MNWMKNVWRRKTTGLRFRKQMRINTQYTRKGKKKRGADIPACPSFWEYRLSQWEKAFTFSSGGKCPIVIHQQPQFPSPKPPQQKRRRIIHRQLLLPKWPSPHPHPFPHKERRIMIQIRLLHPQLSLWSIKVLHPPEQFVADKSLMRKTSKFKCFC